MQFLPIRRLTVCLDLDFRTCAAALRPNPSLKLTRYGMRCKPGPRHMVHYRSPGLQRMPPQAA
jgi:hypothetical protein